MRRLLGFLVLFLFALKAHSYSSVTVPLSDPAYRQLDKLAGFGLVKTMMQGQRPYVRSEIARLIAEAMENYPSFEAKYREAPEMDVETSGKWLRAKVYLDGLLRDLKDRFRPELIQRGALPGEVPRFQGRVFDYVQFDFIYLDEDTEIIIPENGLGGVSAILQPLVAYREGRHYQKGANWSFETQNWIRLGKYFSFQAEPRFQMQVARDGLQDETQVFVQRLNGRFTWNKLDIEIGRDSIDWGPSNRGGLTFSSNPRPLDMIKISSVSPFYYPFFFRKLGMNEMSLVVANLGSDQVFKNPWLVAYKISNRRNPYFEFGFSQALILGGEGAPDIGFGGGVVEFFDITSNDESSLRNVAIELIGRIPKFRGLEIYSEVQFADFSTNLETLFVDDTSYLAGAYLPRLNFSGTLDLRVEYRRLAPRYARSPIFTDGMTEDNRLLGDPLGPDAWAVSLQTFYEMNSQNWFSFSFQFSRRHQDFYRHLQDGSVVQILDGADQNRFLCGLAWKHWFRSNLEGHIGVGFGHVQNPNFVSGTQEWNWAGEAGFKVYLPSRYQVGYSR
jgi:hypothetical protein